MTNKTEKNKKEYSTPKMEVVELKHEVNLLQDSSNCPPPYYCHEGG